MDEIEENTENGEINGEIEGSTKVLRFEIGDDGDHGCLLALLALVMVCITIGFIFWVFAWMRIHGG